MNVGNNINQLMHASVIENQIAYKINQK